MKKCIVLLWSVVMCFALVACGGLETTNNEQQSSESNSQHETTNNSNEASSESTVASEKSVENFLYENDVSPYRYENYFADKYTPEEFVALCRHFEQYDAELQYAICKNAYMVMQDFSTYNKVDERYSVMSYDGSILYDYENNDWVSAANTSLTNIGYYTFVKTNGNPATYDIFNENGEFIRTFDENSSVNYYPANIRLRADLGSDYYLFENDRYGDGKGSGDYYVLNPKGEFWVLHSYYYDFQVMKSYYSDMDLNITLGKTDGYVNGHVEVGKISEDKFAIWGNNAHRGYFGVYFDVQGNRLIDLSGSVTKFKVTNLGEFSGGQAEIEFWGADGKKYVGIIDISGEFISEPKHQK